MSTKILPKPSCVKSALSLTLLPALLAPVAAIVTGCSANQASVNPAAGATTTVTLLSTSTANDALFRMHLLLNSMSLVDKSGNQVPLISAPVYPEFAHVNGSAEPIAVSNVRQGTYTSATMNIGSALYSCAHYIAGAGANAEGVNAGSVPASSITIALPVPITISGSATALSLDLLTSQSIGQASCDPFTLNTTTITPDFVLSPASVSSSSAGSGNNIMNGLQGIVSAVAQSGGLFTVTSLDESFPTSAPAGDTFFANAPVWQVGVNAGTVFQGISGLSAIGPGTPVDIDLQLVNGSLVASRIAVYDTNQAYTSLWNGPILDINNPQRAIVEVARGVAGPIASDIDDFNFTSAQFGISSQFTNLANLPFTPVFSATTMVPGQVVDMTMHQSSAGAGYPNLATVTLMPQTLNGTVTAISQADGSAFTVYTIQLAQYDLFPNLANLPSQAGVLLNPSQVVVYADSNTQLLNSGSITVGSVYRFNGLVFNDHGTLRMDCAGVMNGVAE